MNQIHDAMRIGHFLNPEEEVVEDADGDILADIVLTYSVDEARADDVDDEEPP
jgi:hypothetical protein